MDSLPTFTPSDFVASLNQTFEYAYPQVVVEGEIANFKVSKGKWVYFDLKDDEASVKFFGSVYSLPGPLEDGLVVKVTGSPRLSQLYGFSVNFRAIQAVGEGSLKRAADLLRAKLDREGLFDPARKRTIVYPAQRIGLGDVRRVGGVSGLCESARCTLAGRRNHSRRCGCAG
jgi:exodeoxyribonuclease VII large subunit